jgi:predicted Ser/Thr protein kinase
MLLTQETENLAATVPGCSSSANSLRTLLKLRGRLTLKQCLPILEAIRADMAAPDPHFLGMLSPDFVHFDSQARAYLDFAPVALGFSNPRSRPQDRAFAAPEMFADEPVDVDRALVFSLAALATWMVGGPSSSLGGILEGPTEQPPGDPWTDSLGISAREFLRQGLSPDPLDRPATAGAFLEELRSRQGWIGRYRVMRRIGRGATGTVYLAQSGNDDTVAIKTLDPSHASDSNRVLRFYREARLGMEIEHENLVEVFEVGQDRGIHFMVMQYVEGMNLASYVQQYGFLPENESLRIAHELGRALATLHARGITHRDVNPENAMIGLDGKIKLLDLGLAQVGDFEFTSQDRAVGNPQYIAPEQFRGARHASPSSDIYGLGATLFWMLTGKEPFSGTDFRELLAAKLQNRVLPLRQVNSALSVLTANFVRRSVAARPQDRPADILEFVRTLRHCMQRIDRHCERKQNDAESGSVAARTWRVVYVDRTGASQQLECGDVQIARLIEQGVLNGSTQVVQPGESTLTPLRDVREFRAMLKRRNGSRRALADFQRSLTVVRSQVAQLVRGAIRWCHDEPTP